jgi:oligosaccharide repeat unit polymerase
MIFSPFFFLCLLLASKVVYARVDLKPLLFGFLIFYAITIIKSIYLFGFFSVYSIYLYAGVFFIYSRFFFDLIGYENFLYVTAHGTSRTFTPTTGFILLCICFLSHYVMDLTYSFLSLSKKEVIIKEINHNDALRAIGIISIFALLPVVLYKLYLQYMYVKSHNYLVIFNGDMAENVKMPFWTYGSGTLFLTAYLLVIISRPSKNVFLMCSFLYLFSMLFSSLRGQRNIFLTNLVAVIFFHMKLYPKKRPPLKLLMSLLLILVSFSIFMGYLRENNKLSRVDINKLVFNLFYGKGGTILLPLIIIEDGNTLKYHPYPFIFSPLLSLYYKTVYPTIGQSTILVRRYNSLDYVITYKWAPGRFLEGNGLGSSVLAEMYDCGGIAGVIFWSFIAALFFYFIERFVLRNIPCLVLSWFSVVTISWFPRNSFFRGDTHIIIIIIMAIIVMDFYAKHIKIQKPIINRRFFGCMNRSA